MGYLNAKAHGYACAADKAAWKKAIEAWYARVLAAGTFDSSYCAAVYALREGFAWPRTDAPPESVEKYLRTWFEASRWRGGGLAPEDVDHQVESIFRTLAPADVMCDDSHIDELDAAHDAELEGDLA